MYVYLLLILPAALAAIWRQRLSNLALLFVWFVTSGLMLVLMPVGSRDYTIYLRDFEDMNARPLAELLLQDPLYAGTVWLVGHLGVTGEVFIATLAVAALLVKLTALVRLGGRSSLVVLLYMSSFFFLHEFTQVRAALALGIWMHGLAELDRSRWRYAAWTLLATLVHLQAALGFLLLAVLAVVRTRRATLAFVAGAAALVAVSATRLLDQLGYALIALIPDPRTQIYLDLAANDLWVRPNPFSAISLLAFATAAFGLLGPRVANPFERPGTLPETHRAIFLALLVGSCSLALLSSVAVAAFRISEHFFSLLPAGLWLSACMGRARPNNYLRWPLWIIAGMLAYLFIVHSPYLLEPATGEPTREDA